MESDNIQLEINKDISPPQEDPPPSKQVGVEEKEEDEFDFGEAVYDEEKYGGLIGIEMILYFTLFYMVYSSEMTICPCFCILAFTRLFMFDIQIELFLQWHAGFWLTYSY